VNRSKLKPLILGALAAIGIGITLTLQFRGWPRVFETGSCGNSRKGQPDCAPGSISVDVLTFFSFFSMVGLVLVVIYSIGKIGWKIGYPSGAALLAIGVAPGLLIFNAIHGPVVPALDILWKAPPDQQSGLKAQGAWLQDDLVIRARVDQVIAYDLATGATRWTYPIPGQQVLCAMSRGTDDGTGLIAYADEGKECAHLVAVDLSTGRPRWERNIPAERLGGHAVPDTIAVAADTAVVKVSSEQVLGLGLREGQARWALKEDGNCRYESVVASADQAVVRVDCPDKPPQIRALDAATGRTRWQSPLQISGTSANVELLSAVPPVARIREGGARGRTMVQAFDPTGRVTTVYTANGDHDLSLSTDGFDAAPARRVFVADGKLIGEVDMPSGQGVAAYDLADGRKLWTTKLDNGVESLQVDGSRLLVLGDRAATPDLTAVALATGKSTYLGAVRVSPLALDVALFASGNTYAIVAESVPTPDYNAVVVARKP
jgi:outer membrane protein assembly factor BamB